MGSRPIVKTVNGHELGDVVSALQKSIRRGEVDDALYFAVDMDLSGYGEYVWSRLLVMASEDVGIAERGCCARIQSLYATYGKLKAKKNDHAPERLMLIHAVIELCFARKSRLVDTALISHYGMHQELKREIPDYALDAHTRRGRMRLKNDARAGVDYFYEEGATVNQAPSRTLDALEESYQAAARDFQSKGGQLPPPGVTGQQRLV